MSSTAGERIANLNKIFYPSTLAVLGATKIPGTVPFDIFYNILKDGFQGTIYPVSPSARSIAGVRAYKYVLDIPDPVDLAVIVFQSSVVHLALEQCGQKGIKAAIIISAGFREVGGAGLERERQIKEIADKYGISFIGPNCLGVINTDPLSHLNASFARKMPCRREHRVPVAERRALHGGARLRPRETDRILQVRQLREQGGHQRHRPDVCLRDDPKTKVILVYLEEITRRSGIHARPQATSFANSGKPVLVIKSGRTKEGAAAAASHTGSLAGSDEVDGCGAAAGRRHPLLRRSRRCSTSRSRWRTSRSHAASGWRSSRTPAARASWPRTRPSRTSLDARDSSPTRPGEMFKKSPACDGEHQEPGRRHRRRAGDRYHVALSQRAEGPRGRRDAGHPDAAVDDRHRRPSPSRSRTVASCSREAGLCARSWGRRTSLRASPSSRNTTSRTTFSPNRCAGRSPRQISSASSGNRRKIRREDLPGVDKEARPEDSATLRSAPEGDICRRTRPSGCSRTYGLPVLPYGIARSAAEAAGISRRQSVFPW